MHIGNMHVAKEISSRIVNDKKVGLAADIPVSGEIPPELDLYKNRDLGIFITYSRSRGPFKKTLRLTPRCHILGIGCRTDIPVEIIERFANEVLEEENISAESVRAVASIDLKSNEAGILEFAEKIKAETVFFSSKELASLPDMGFTPSEMVKAVTGVDNVCERAAFAASKDGKIVVRKVSKNGVTLAVVREPAYLDLMRW
jgi:cobalt-precorrin 5A hydrolase